MKDVLLETDKQRVRDGEKVRAHEMKFSVVLHIADLLVIVNIPNNQDRIVSRRPAGAVSPEVLPSCLIIPYS